VTRKPDAGRVFFALIPLLVTGSAAQATLANRVFVAARTGNDGNACSSVSTPCQTFAGALLQVNAGGEIIALESGGYGPVTITKAVNINAPAGIVAFIHPPSGDAVTISAGAADTVILRGLSLNGGTGNGVTVVTVGQLFVEHCTITGFAVAGIALSGGALFMRDDDVRKCGTGLVVASARAVIRDSSFVDNASHGVWAKANGIVAATDCIAAQNGDGFRASTAIEGADANMTLERVQAVGNGTGIVATIDSTLLTGIGVVNIANSVITQNTTGITWFGNTSAVYGTSPGTNLVYANSNNGTAPISNIDLK